MKTVARSEAGKRRVLFVCIGNSCRSQMAEGFARKYGSDVMEALSAGTAPASIVQPLTQQVMEEKNISLDGQYPKHVSTFDLSTFDLIINMSGYRLPGRPSVEVREWTVVDPVGRSEDVYTAVRDDIEAAVMRLILELRTGRTSATRSPEPGTPVTRVPETRRPEKREAPAHGSSPFRMGRRR
jgi:arsenate reductase (thioredoxin)